MTIDELGKKAILILGFGTEGQATYEYLRRKWPDKLLSIADRQNLVEFSDEVHHRIQSDCESQKGRRHSHVALADLFEQLSEGQNHWCYGDKGQEHDGIADSSHHEACRNIRRTRRQHRPPTVDVDRHGTARHFFCS